jgi:hypothetical protein
VPILEVAQGDPPGLRERRLSCAELMKRVFREDVLRCKKCGGRAAVISAIAQPKVASPTFGLCYSQATEVQSISVRANSSGSSACMK